MILAGTRSSLTQLGKLFELYESNWYDWLKASESKLTIEQLYTLEVYRENNFEIKPGEEEMFYNAPSRIKEIEIGLNASLPEYQTWVIQQLVDVFENVAGGENLKKKYETPFGQLKIPLLVAAMFVGLGCRTADELFSYGNKERLKSLQNFRHVLDVLFVVRAYRKKNHQVVKT